MVNITNISSLGNVYTESCSIKNNLLQISLPSILGGTTANKSLLNILGKTRNITLTGAFPGSVAEITAFIVDMEEWANNGAQTARTYTGTFFSISVLCDDFTWDYANSPFSVNWRLALIQGSVGGLIRGV